MTYLCLYALNASLFVRLGPPGLCKCCFEFPIFEKQEKPLVLELVFNLLMLSTPLIHLHPILTSNRLNVLSYFKGSKSTSNSSEFFGLPSVIWWSKFDESEKLFERSTKQLLDHTHIIVMVLKELLYDSPSEERILVMKSKYDFGFQNGSPLEIL